MTKRELARIYKEKETISLRQAEKEINIFLETLQEALLVDGQIKLFKKGIFEIQARKPKYISNPVTKELMTIHPKSTVKFRASKKVLDRWK